MNNFIYSGIGNRDTPLGICYLLRDIASLCERKKGILRSGGANGADSYFEKGVKDSNNKEIYIPFDSYNNRNIIYNIPSKAFDIARMFHPVWNRLSLNVKTLMARNVCIVLGHTLDKPSDFVICYTRDGAYNTKTVTSKTGGTGMAIKLADHYNIPIYNIRNIEQLNDLYFHLDKYE